MTSLLVPCSLCFSTKQSKTFGAVLGDAFGGDFSENQNDDRNDNCRVCRAERWTEQIDKEHGGDGRQTDVDDVVADKNR